MAVCTMVLDIKTHPSLLRFLEESTASGVQWLWPVLSVLSVALVCLSVGAVNKYKGNNY